MRYPTWQDVAIPLTLVNSIKGLRECYALDAMVYQLVVHARRKPALSYHCLHCNFINKPDRNSEDVFDCASCGNRTFKVSAKWRWRKDIPYYCRFAPIPIHQEVISFLEIMTENYTKYFSGQPECIVDCGWDTKTTSVYAQFLGGEKVVEQSPRLCLVKAALLCPYLWDAKFDWHNDGNNNIITSHLTPIFHYFCNNSWIGKPYGQLV